MYSIKLGIPNKCTNSTHCQFKHETLDDDEAHFLIFARDLAIEITIQSSTIQISG
jgi:hypothetical protein